jgi:proliferating cell nuclear antigen
MIGKMGEINCEKYAVHFKTVQSNAIKTLVESLKDILNDVNIKFNEEGIQIITIDGKHIAIVHLKLVAEHFEYFYCERTSDQAPFEIGINMKSLYTLLKTIGNNDIITMFVEKNDTTKLHIVIENKDKKTKDISKLRLLDFDDDIYKIPDIEFDSVIKMPSNDFQKICKDLSNISEIVTIRNEDNKFIMTVEGDIGEKQIIIEENINVEFQKLNNEIVEGKYDLKYLLLFIKSSNLCSTIELFLKKDHPLVLLYSVASLGSLKFVLAPKVS